MVPLSKSGGREPRGFESHPLRVVALYCIRRGARVDDQARLESACSRKATMGSNPILSAICVKRPFTHLTHGFAIRFSVAFELTDKSAYCTATYPVLQ